MKTVLLCCCLFVKAAVCAQTTVENFVLTNVADGSQVSLDVCPACSGVAIIFTGTACPYDEYYTGRISDLINAYQGRIQFLLINSYPEAEESIEKMKAFQSSHGLSVPYLADKDQIAMNALGAKRSPEVFLLNKVNNKHVVIYNGAIDDNPQVATSVTQSYLKAAIEKLLASQKIDTPTARAVGCSIRKK